MLPELRCDLVKEVTEHLGGLTFLVEQIGLGEERDEGLRLGEDLVQLVSLGHHLGRVELQVDLIEVAASPTGEVAIHIGPLVVEQAFGSISVDLESLVVRPCDEPPLQLGVRRFIVIFVLGLPAV